MPNTQAQYTKAELVQSLERSQNFGFLSPQPIENQISHSEAFISLVPDFNGRVLDLGAGGGLPSLVWLHLNLDIKITALDAMRKRTDFLENERSKNASLVNRLEVLNGRAEELGNMEVYRECFGLVVARGFGAPTLTAECASGFLAVGGILVVSGRPENEMDRWSTSGLEALGLTFKEVRSGEKCHAAIIEKTSALQSKFPRKPSSMAKSPLW